MKDWETRFDKICNLDLNSTDNNGVLVCDIDIKFKEIKELFRSEKQSLLLQIEEIVGATELKVLDREFLNKDVIEFYKNAVEETKKVILERINKLKE